MSIKRSFSGLLWNILREQYRRLGFDRLNDEIFEALCLARIVEPTSKQDSLRVLADLRVERIDRNKLYRSLAKLQIRIIGKLSARLALKRPTGRALR